MVWIWKTWFQQDSTSCHTARETTELLGEKFRGHVISHNGNQNWPPRLCDLTPCDFFLWGFVKSHIYASKPQTISELKAEIQHVIGEIEPQLCGNVCHQEFCQKSKRVPAES
jgi:hypothetical protein